jgi:hypothetical protein
MDPLAPHQCLNGDELNNAMHAGVLLHHIERLASPTVEAAVGRPLAALEDQTRSRMEQLAVTGPTARFAAAVERLAQHYPPIVGGLRSKIVGVLPRCGPSIKRGGRRDTQREMGEEGEGVVCL